MVNFFKRTAAIETQLAPAPPPPDTSLPQQTETDLPAQENIPFNPNFQPGTSVEIEFQRLLRTYSAEIAMMREKHNIQLPDASAVHLILAMLAAGRVERTIEGYQVSDELFDPTTIEKKMNRPYQGKKVPSDKMRELAPKIENCLETVKGVHQIYTDYIDLTQEMEQQDPAWFNLFKQHAYGEGEYKRAGFPRVGFDTYDIGWQLFGITQDGIVDHSLSRVSNSQAEAEFESQITNENQYWQTRTMESLHRMCNAVLMAEFQLARMQYLPEVNTFGESHQFFCQKINELRGRMDQALEHINFTVNEYGVQRDNQGNVTKKEFPGIVKPLDAYGEFCYGYRGSLPRVVERGRDFDSNDTIMLILYDKTNKAGSVLDNTSGNFVFYNTVNKKHVGKYDAGIKIHG